LLLTDKAEDAKKYAAIDKWSTQLANLQQTIFNKIT